MFRKWAHGLVIGLLLGSLFVAFPAAQNYVWSSINGVPYAPGLVVTNLTVTADISFGASNDLLVGRESAAILQLGADAAGTVAQTIKSNDRITSDGVGGDLTIAAGRGRGAAGGSLYFQTAAAAGAGVDGTLVTRMTIDPAGNIVSAGDLYVTTGSFIGLNRFSIYGTSGVVTLDSSAFTGLTALTLGPTTGNTGNGTLSISKVQVTCTIDTSTNCSGVGTGTITTSTGIPAGSLVLAVDARVSTAITGGGGIASFSMGFDRSAGLPAADDTDAYGAGHLIAANTLVTIGAGTAGYTITSPQYFTHAANLTLTANTGTFSTGVVKFTIYYISTTPIA